MLTGFHGAHVTIGILMLLSLFQLSRMGKIPPSDSLKGELVGLYWHFVDVVWIVIFTVVSLIRAPGKRAAPPPRLPPSMPIRGPSSTSRAPSSSPSSPASRLGSTTSR